MRYLILKYTYIGMKRLDPSLQFALGSSLPIFTLKNVDGTLLSSIKIPDSIGILVVFTCNHCPYVKGSEHRLIELASEYRDRGLTLITINSNDPTSYPEDSFEKMQSKASALKLPYPYLLDDTQEVARSFDAACTPECYLFNKERKLVYHGAINDNPSNFALSRSDYIGRAVAQLIGGEPIDPNDVNPIGCSIKWRG